MSDREIAVETKLPGPTMVVVNGREMDLHFWIYSVEARLISAGLTLEKLEAGSNPETETVS